MIDESQEEVIKSQHNQISDKNYSVALKFIELKSKEIFWMALYTFILLAIFAERAYCKFNK